MVSLCNVLGRITASTALLGYHQFFLFDLFFHSFFDKVLAVSCAVYSHHNRKIPSRTGDALPWLGCSCYRNCPGAIGNVDVCELGATGSALESR